MISRIRNYVSRHLTEGHSRTLKAKKNIVGLFGLRALSTVVSFLLVPLTLNYLNPTRYGIWLTLTSMITWITVLDVGLGAGLRNKFTEAVARGETELARSYVSTSYAFISLVVGMAMLAFWAINPMLHWARLLNSPGGMEAELSSLAGIVFTFFCLRLVFGLIGTILTADQRPAMNNLLEVLTNISSLLVIYIMTKTVQGSLFWVGFVISSTTVLVPMVANVWFFNGKYAMYIPSFRYVKFTYVRDLMSLGVQFFVIQMAALFIFSTSNFIITQFYGPAEVTPFNIAFKYFGIALSVFLLILTPFWSAYTEASVKGDSEWIERTNKKLKKIWYLMVLGVVVMVLIADRVYALWVGNAIHVPFSLSATMALYVLIIAWCSIFAYFVNSTGKLRLQLWAAVIIAIENVGLSILFAKTHTWGSTGVILATCIALFPSCFLWPIQMKKLLRGTATGVWAK